MLTTSFYLALAGFVASVSAHGLVIGITSGGKDYQGADPWIQNQPIVPQIPGWFAENWDNGFVDPPMYSTSDVICHLVSCFISFNWVRT